MYAPADVRAVFEQPVGDRSFADLRTLFGEFVDQRIQDQTYEPDFAAAFRDRGSAALDEALRRAEEATAATEPAA